MAAMDDEQPRAKAPSYVVGQEIARLSVAELTTRIAELEAEIVRLKAERDRRGATRDAAEALFRR